MLLGEVTASGLERRFLSGEFDVAIGYQETATERREFAGAQRIDLLEETFKVGLPPGHRLADARGPLALAELAGDDSDRPLYRRLPRSGLPRTRLRTPSDPLATRGLIARGIGVGWVPSLLADDYSGAVIRRVKDPIRRRDIYALLPPGHRHPHAQHVIDAISKTARELHADA